MFHILNCKYNQFNFCGVLIYAEESQGSKTTASLKDETYTKLRRQAWNQHAFQNLQVHNT